MKKYDITLVVLYVVLAITASGVGKNLHNKNSKAQSYYKELIENQNIDSVVIEDVDANIEVFYGKENDSIKWRARGYINHSENKKLNQIYIENNTLHIANIKNPSLTQIKVGRGIPIEIKNSPKVKILSDQRLKDKLNNTKIKYKYDF